MSAWSGKVAVVFDLDGLMFNTEDLYDEVCQLVLQKRGHPFTNEMKLEMMGLPGLLAMDVMRDRCHLDEPAARLLDELHGEMADRLPDRLQTMPGLVELLQRLDSIQLPRSIATSSPREFANRCLEIFGLSGLFSFVLTADDVRRGKPHPEIYLTSAEKHGVPPSAMLVLEDSLNGSRAAASAGAYTVAVPGHHSIGQDFSHVDLVVESLESRRLFDVIRRFANGDLRGGTDR